MLQVVHSMQHADSSQDHCYANGSRYACIILPQEWTSKSCALAASQVCQIVHQIQLISWVTGITKP
jgi:hypothetical protein